MRPDHAATGELHSVWHAKGAPRLLVAPLLIFSDPHRYKISFSNNHDLIFVWYSDTEQLAALCLGLLTAELERFGFGGCRAGGNDLTVSAITATTPIALSIVSPVIDKNHKHHAQ